MGLLLPFKSSSFRSFLLWCPSSSRFHGPPYAPLRYTSLREASRVSDRLRRGTMRGVECVAERRDKRQDEELCTGDRKLNREPEAHSQGKRRQKMRPEIIYSCPSWFRFGLRLFHSVSRLIPHLQIINLRCYTVVAGEPDVVTSDVTIRLWILELGTRDHIIVTAPPYGRNQSWLVWKWLLLYE